MDWAPYYKNDTGFPSVTDILRPWVNAEWFTEESRTRGSWVHDAIAAHLTDAPAFLTPPPRPQWQGYVDSILSWVGHAIKRMIMVERRMVDPSRGYCGQLDLLGELTPAFGGGTGLIDWKTGAGVEPTWDLQGMAYCMLSKQKVDRILFIRPKADGTGCLPAHEVVEPQRSWALFQAAVALHQHFNGRKG